MLTNLIREKRKTLSITIDRMGEMQIKAPQNLPLNEIISFVKSKEKWIVSKQTQVKNQLNLNKDVIDYNKILFLGNQLECICLNNINQIEMQDKKLFLPEKFVKKKNKYIANWLKNKAFSIIENRILYFSTNCNLSFKTLALINSKTKWGTCSISQEICFNWRLIMLSPRLIDYVVVHELVHTIQPNHSVNFWKGVEAIIPDYKNRKEEIKKCGFILNLFR